MPLSRTRSLLSNINGGHGGGHGGHGGGSATAASGASSNSSATTPNDGLDSTVVNNTGRGQFGKRSGSSTKWSTCNTMICFEFDMIRRKFYEFVESNS